ncbi:MAG: GNAT family N-acetyltransferase [Dehalococcoidia bacterium]
MSETSAPRVFQCLCGERPELAEGAQLFDLLRAHYRAAHPDRTATDDDIRTIVAKSAGPNPWDGSSRPLPGPIEVKGLSPERVTDFLTFFDGDAFMDNPAWASCYCLYYQLDIPNEEWQARRGDENRAAKAELIRDGKSHGVLAYADGKPVGWCHAAPKADLPAFRDGDVASDDTPDVGSIVCFVVAAPYRGQGLGRRLIDAACDELRSLGLKVAEAYPLREGISQAQNYHGTLGMYLDAGFEVVRDVEDRAVVRKGL